MHLATRRVHIAGITPYPDGQWMTQVARNVTMADVGFLCSTRYLIHDRDSKFCESFQLTLEAVGIKTVKLPAKSPNLNSFAERWVESAKGECLSKLILFGERSLRLALKHYVTHFHQERNHQGKGNLLLFPPSEQTNRVEGPVRCRGFSNKRRVLGLSIVTRRWSFGKKTHAAADGSIGAVHRAV